MADTNKAMQGAVLRRLKKKDKDKVGKGKTGAAATDVNKTIKGGARGFVSFFDTLLGKKKKDGQ